MANQQHGRQASPSGGRRSTGPWLGRSLVQPAVVGLFHRHGVLNGARLGEILGVGRSSAHLILDRLHRQGCLLVEGRRIGGALPPGRPTTDYRLNPAHGEHVGVCVHGAQLEWAAIAYDGSLSASGTEALESPPGNVRALAGALRTALDRVRGGGWRKRTLHLGLPFGGSLSPRATWTDEGVAESAFEQVGLPPPKLVPAADAGAIAESIRVRSTPEPTLFVVLGEDFTCPTGYACGSGGLTSSRRRATTIDSVAKRRALWLANAPAAEWSVTWSELAVSASLGGRAAELHGALSEELAEEVAKFAAFLDVSRVMLAAGPTLLERLMPSLARDVEARLRDAGRPAPEVVASPRVAHMIAMGAALMPIAATIARSIEFESLSRGVDPSLAPEGPGAGVRAG